MVRGQLGADNSTVIATVHIGPHDVKAVVRDSALDGVLVLAAVVLLRDVAHHVLLSVVGCELVLVGHELLLLGHLLGEVVGAPAIDIHAAPCLASSLAGAAASVTTGT